MSGSIAPRVEQVRERIAAAASDAGRDPGEVTLVAVAKTFGADAVVEAAEAGVSDIGESRVQELTDKAAVVGDRVRWHFVGHLQTNKVKAVVGVAGLIHSLDRLPLAERISARAQASGLSQRVLVQVNVAGEDSKHGVAPEEAPALAEQAAALPGLEVAGLMTIPPAATDPRVHFAALRELRDRLTKVLPGATELSMGMSADFEVAVAEGATLVRVGEAIFGPR